MPARAPALAPDVTSRTDADTDDRGVTEARPARLKRARRVFPASSLGSSPPSASRPRPPDPFPSFIDRRRGRPFDDDAGSPRARSRAASSVSSPFANSAPASTSKATTFLIGAYAKYDQPYAWLRSGAERDASDEQDLPLDLDATTRWKETRHRVWDVAEELVRTCVFPNPRNAFAVDHAALERLPRRERFLSTGALVAFLLELVRDAPGRDAERDAAVERDLVKLVETHLASTPTALERKTEGAEGTEAGGSLQASQATSGNAGK